MYFKITFQHWLDSSQEAFDGLSTEELRKEKEKLETFLVDKETEEGALKYAKRFEGLETHAYEGLGSIIDIIPATQEEIKLMQALSIYERYLKNQNK